MPIDNSNMLKAIEDFPHQCKTALELPKGIAVSGKVDKIVVIGMGGSAVGGDLLKAYMQNSKIPVFVVRDYKVPGFVDENTLVFAVSYSGNTEETLSAFEDAVKKKAKVAAVTSGGVLSVKAKKVIKIPVVIKTKTFNLVRIVFITTELKRQVRASAKTPGPKK